MNARTKAKLALAAGSVAAMSPVVGLTIAVRATINGPYASDGNTVALYHFDEAAGASTATNASSLAPVPAFTWSQPTATAAGSLSTAVLGQVGFTGFGSAATFSGALLAGYDGNGDSAFTPDLSTNTTNTNTSPDAISSTLLTDGNGAFSLEALVNIPGTLTGNKEIVSFDSSNATAGQRGFQFRISGGNIEYNNIADAFGSVTAAIPTTGAHAFASNTWFHVAMSYDGSGAANSVKLYWTKLDAANTLASFLNAGQAGDLTAASNPNLLTIGNENRNTAGEAFNGLLDEVRISNTLRLANQFVFGGSVLNYWNNTGSGDWDLAGDWTLGVPNASGAIANFGGGAAIPAGDTTVTLNGTKTVGSMAFDSSFKFTLASGTAGSLALDNGAGAATITALTGAHEIAVPVNVGANGVTVTNTGAGTLTFSGTVSGTGGLTKAGAGVLVLTGTNNYGGATTLSEGVLRATNNVGLSSSSNLEFNGGIFETGANFERAAGTGAGEVQFTGGNSGFSANGADILVAVGTIASPTTLQWGSTTFAPAALVLNAATATHAVNFLNPIDVNGAARSVAVNAQTATLSGIISDGATGGGLTKTGGGTLVLTGANTYGGATLVSGGILRATDGAGLSTNTNLALNGGLFQTSTTFTRTLGTGAGQVQLTGGNSGFVTQSTDVTYNIQNGGVPILWGGATFNPGALILNQNASTNAVTLNADLDLNAAARFVGSNGTGISNTFSGVMSGTGSLRVDGTAPLVLTNTNTFTGGTIIDSGPQDASIARAAANDALGTGGVTIGEGGNATSARLELSGGISLPNAIALNGRSNDSVGVQNISGSNTMSGRISLNAGGNRYWLQSDAGLLTLTGAEVAAAGIAIGAGSGSRIVTFRGAGDGAVSGNVQNAGGNVAVVKDGAGIWTLSGTANTYTGTTTVNAGTLRLASNLTGTTGVSVTGGTLELASGGGSNRVIKTPTVGVTSGRIDLKDNKLITASPLGSWNGSNYTDVAGLVDSGRGGGSNAQWDGSGIVTSDTRAVNNNDLLSIGTAKFGSVKGIADTATTTFAGQTVLGSDTIAMVTWGGDANLDGKINIDDYGQIDFNVTSSGSVFGWYNGDFNYDGKINIDDYGIIDFNVSAQDSIFPTVGGIDGVAAVPEPGGLALLTLAPLLRRRRSPEASPRLGMTCLWGVTDK